MTLDGLTAAEIARRIGAREVSAEEVARASLDRIASAAPTSAPSFTWRRPRAPGKRRLDQSLAAGPRRRSPVCPSP
jgi:Asp-tRNA(Asn)/Glu-tRNA(Gln) amidotransferase A subunit family amidase